MSDNKCKYYINCYKYGGFCDLVGADMDCDNDKKCIWYKDNKQAI